MSKVEDVAARLWRSDSEDAGVPASIAKGRTLEAFRDQSDETRARWFKFARAAIEAMDNPSDEFLHALSERMHDARFSRSGEDYPVARNFIRAFVDAALSEEGE